MGRSASCRQVLETTDQVCPERLSHRKTSSQNDDSFLSLTGSAGASSIASTSEEEVHLILLDMSGIEYGSDDRQHAQLAIPEDTGHAHSLSPKETFSASNSLISHTPNLEGRETPNASSQQSVLTLNEALPSISSTESNCWDIDDLMDELSILSDEEESDPCFLQPDVNSQEANVTGCVDDFSLENDVHSLFDEDETCSTSLDNYLSVKDNKRVHELHDSLWFVQAPSPDPCDVHASESELIFILKQNNAPIKMYAEVMAWAKSSFTSGYFSNSASPQPKQHSYKTALKHLLKAYGKSVGGPPMSTPFQIGPLPQATVFHMSFLHQAHCLLNDPYLMDDANWCFQYNSGMLSDLNTGEYWRNAERRLCSQLGVEDLPPDHVLAPIICFDDETFCDKKGRLKAQPVLFTLGNIRMSK